jgi:hypothetical protein
MKPRVIRMTYRIFDIDVGLLISPEAEINEFFPEDESGITHRLAIVSEIEAEAKMTMHHFHMPQDEQKARSKLNTFTGVLAVYDASSQEGKSHLIDFIKSESSHLHNKPVIMIDIGSEKVTSYFREKRLLVPLEVSFFSVTNRKELDTVMREFGSRLIHIRRSEEDV